MKRLLIAVLLLAAAPVFAATANPVQHDDRQGSASIC